MGMLPLELSYIETSRNYKRAKAPAADPGKKGMELELKMNPVCHILAAS